MERWSFQIVRLKPTEAEADGWIGSPLPKQDLLFCSGVVGWLVSEHGEERGSFYAAPAKVSLRSR